MPEAPSEVSLRAAGLTLTRASAHLGPVSFSLTHPGCWWLAGTSGAGKSLLLESLAGFHAEATGSVRVGAREVGNLAPERRSIALMPQRWRLFPHWTVARNLEYAARLSATPAARVEALADCLEVAPLMKRQTRELSGGETQRIALIQTLLSPVGVLLLDEPLSAVDAALQSAVLDLLSEEAQSRRRICLIAAHRPKEGYPLQGILWIEQGKLLPKR